MARQIASTNYFIFFGGEKKPTVEDHDLGVNLFSEGKVSGE